MEEPNKEKNQEKRANRNWMWINIVSQGGEVTGSGRISLASGPHYTRSSALTAMHFPENHAARAV